MNCAELTLSDPAARVAPMRGNTTGSEQKLSGGRLAAGILLAGSLALTGCVNVNAPAEPIVIELNINIRQEVIYRLAEDAGKTIEENADIF